MSSSHLRVLNISNTFQRTTASDSHLYTVANSMWGFAKAHELLLRLSDLYFKRKFLCKSKNTPCSALKLADNWKWMSNWHDMPGWRALHVLSFWSIDISSDLPFASFPILSFQHFLHSLISFCCCCSELHIIAFLFRSTMSNYDAW